MEKNILITGANGAVGSVVTKHLISKGYKVIGIDNSLEKISGLLNTGNFIYHGADVTDEKEMNQLIPEIIKTEGQIHGALLLVGGFKYGGVFDTSLTSLTDMIRWNFFSAYNVARMVFQHMLEQSYGRIAFISSKQGIQPSIGSKTVGYTIGKSMLLSYAEILNSAANGRNITTSVIVPSTIDTSSNRKAMPDANTDNWVTTQQIAEILEMVLSPVGNPLRETVLKVYNNS